MVRSHEGLQGGEAKDTVFESSPDAGELEGRPQRRPRRPAPSSDERRRSFAMSELEGPLEMVPSMFPLPISWETEAQTGGSVVAWLGAKRRLAEKRGL